MQKKTVLRGKHINAILPQETRKTSNRQPNITLKATGKWRTTTKKIAEERSEQK